MFTPNSIYYAIIFVIGNRQVCYTWLCSLQEVGYYCACTERHVKVFMLYVDFPQARDHLSVASAPLCIRHTHTVCRREAAGVGELCHQLISHLVIGCSAFHLHLLAHLHGEVPEPLSFLINFLPLAADRHRTSTKNGNVKYVLKEF